MIRQSPPLTPQDLRWWHFALAVLGGLAGALVAAFQFGPGGVRSVLMALAFTGAVVSGLPLVAGRRSTRVTLASRLGFFLGMAGMWWAAGRDGVAVFGVQVAVVVAVGTLVGPAVATQWRRRFGR